MRPPSLFPPPPPPPLKPDPEGLELLLPWYFQLPSRFMSKYPVLCFGIQFNPIYEHPLDTETSLLRTVCFVPGGKKPVYFVYLTLESSTNPLKRTPR